MGMRHPNVTSLLIPILLRLPTRPRIVSNNAAKLFEVHGIVVTGVKGRRQPLDSPTVSRFFEDFAVGDVYEHKLGRTVTTTDNQWFSLLTLNANPLHVDHHYSAQTEFGRPLVNSAFTLALVTGMSVADVSENAVANLGWHEVKLTAPVFEGDTLYARSTVLEARASASRPHAGIVRVKTTGYKPDGTVVIELERSVMVYRRGRAPTR
jgi:itaconyl-CoA hydratase